jgi:catechol 2,3-dioxygenase-like lactoylglutathione lyase family enzyme
MKATIALLAVLGVAATAGPAEAQLLAAKDGPVTIGHYHLHVTSIDEHKKFWVEALGGKAVKVGPLEAVQFPNVFVFLQQAKLDAARASTVDHIAFQVANLKAVVDAVKAAGFMVTTRADVNRMFTVENDIASLPEERRSVAFVVAPDGAKVELIERRTAQPPSASPPAIAFDHLHFTVPDVTAAKQWYIRTFGASAGSQTFQYKAADLPGLPAALQFSRPDRAAFTLTAGAPAATPGGLGTRNQVVDHIGFEVRDLEAFTQQLEKAGTKLDVSFRKVPAVGLAIAFVTDPWGTYIELTEGLGALR